LLLYSSLLIYKYGEEIMNIKIQGLLSFYFLINTIYIVPFGDIAPVCVTNNQYNQSTTEPLSKIFDHKFKVGLFCVGSLYVGILIWSINVQNIFKNGWSNWLSHLSLKNLTKIPHNELYQQLHKAIILKYDSNAILDPDQQFLFDTHNEIIALEEYIRIGLRLTKLKIGMFFLITMRSIQIAIIYIKRLKYIRSIVGEYKCTKQIVH